MELSIHPAAKIFPELDDKAFEELMADIEKNGQRYPILTYNGQIIDGRSRARAYHELGEEPLMYEVTVLSGGEPTEQELFDISISANLHRRHLSPKAKREVLNRLLEQFPDASDRKIADMAKTNHHAVGAARKAKAAEVGQDSQSPHVRQRQDKENQIAAAIESNPKASARQIAKEVGTTGKTVSRVLKKHKGASAKPEELPAQVTNTSVIIQNLMVEARGN